MSFGTDFNYFKIFKLIKLLDSWNNSQSIIYVFQYSIFHQTLFYVTNENLESIWLELIGWNSRQIDSDGVKWSI